MSLPASSLICPVCDHAHRRVPLAPGERARCVRCETTLAEGARFGRDTALACALTAALFAAPALVLPFVHVSKLSAARESFACSGVSALWAADMRLTAIWVLLCGAVIPLVLMISLLAILVPRRLGWPLRSEARWLRVARACEEWAMPEVHVLAVLVALAKLGSLVHVQVGPGLWCYAAMAVCLQVAWRSFEFDPVEPDGPTATLAEAA